MNWDRWWYYPEAGVFQQDFDHKLKGIDDQLDVRNDKKQLENDAMVLAWATWRMQTKGLFWG